MSKTLNLILKHWNGELPDVEGHIEFPFNIEEFCRDNDAAYAALEAKLAECVSALEFYADGNGAKDNEVMPNGLFILGKLAREVLARIRNG